MGVDGGGVEGVGREASRLIFKELRLVRPLAPRKASGGASSSAAAARVLFLARRDARLLTLEAARVDLAALLGWVVAAFCRFKPAVAAGATFTVSASTVFGWAGVAATSVKDFEAAGVLMAGTLSACTFTAWVAGGAAAGGSLSRRCRLASFHSFVLSAILARSVVFRGRFFVMVEVVRGSARTRHAKSTHTFPPLVKVSSVAHMPFSMHSSNRERRREGVGLTAREVLLLGVWEGGGGVGTVNCWFVMPPLGAPPSPPVELAMVAGGS
jgi:hypothetical protein